MGAAVASFRVFSAKKAEDSASDACAQYRRLQRTAADTAAAAAEITIPTAPTVNATNLPEQTPKPPVRHRKPPAESDTDAQQAAAAA